MEDKFTMKADRIVFRKPDGELHPFEVIGGELRVVPGIIGHASIDSSSVSTAELETANCKITELEDRIARARNELLNMSSKFLGYGDAEFCKHLQVHVERLLRTLG